MNQISSSYKLACIIYVIFIASSAYSLNLKPGESCASSCRGKEKIFKYEEGKIYVYDFLSTHTIKNPNSEKETLQLELSGKAEISKISACDFGLKLSNINLKETFLENSNVKKDYQMMKTLLENYSLRFGFDDGRVVGICQDKKDNEFAVNVKKAIISSLQVSLDSLDSPNYLTETDISGDCITEYSTLPEPPNFVIVKKIKSIAGCARKNKYFSTLSGRQFEEPMENRHLALLDGSYECNIKMKRSEGLKESICKETQVFKPFSSDKTGSKIEVKHEIRFDTVNNGKVSTETPNTRSDLTMNHGDQAPLFMKKEKIPVLDIAKQLCMTLKKNNAASEKAQLFVKFIRALSDIDYKTIKEVEKYFNDNSECSPNKSKLKNLLIDALPHTKNEEAFKFLIEDSNLQNFQDLGISFFENTTPTIIKLFSNKIGDPKFDNSALLTLSSMIKSFCDKTPGCVLNPDIIYAMNKLVKHIENSCYFDNNKDNEKVLYTLRALGNSGNFHNYKLLIKILESCVSSKVSQNDVKIFAVEALRQFPCHADIDNFLWKVYDDISYSSEVRIQAYLSLIRCPFRETFRKIIQKLNQEDNQQLGSFVWSHISNLMETSDRFKTELRDLLQIFTKPMNDLTRKFNLDFRSYSKNIEKTFQRGYSAVKLDTNILFSNSPIPSSISTNVSVDIFGRSVNILEFGIRGKGISEKLFGRFYPKPHKNAHPDIVKMQKKSENKGEKLSLGVYSRIMGREIFYSPNVLSALTMSILNPNMKFYVDKSFLLLDVIVSVSTITGFPIELTIESALSVDLSSNNMIKLGDINLSLQNNVALQVIGKLQINAHCTKVGIQSYGTVSSDAEFGGKLKTISGLKKDDGTSLTDYQFEINKIPDDKKLLAISNELSLIHNLKITEAKPKYSALLNKCTSDAFLELRGFKLCALVSAAPKYETFLPNIKAELNIKKFSGFKFQFKKQNTLKPIRKLIYFILSLSFKGEEKDTFKFQFQRNIEKKTSMYEISLFNKDIYAKLEVDEKKVTGKVKYGKVEADLSGSIETKGIVSRIINVNIKMGKDEFGVTYNQKFDKGLLISVKAEKKNDKEFSFSSLTSMTLTNHKVFNYFERFRHSTTLKLSGENELGLTLSNDKGNNPIKENKASFETFWKTKSKYNFNIKQKYFWSKYLVVDNSELPTQGTNYTISLEQLFEVGGKKFDVNHDVNFFISNKFLSFENKPLLMNFKVETFDKLKKQYVRQINTKLFVDLNPKNGRFVFRNFINHQIWKISHNLNSKAIWKKNSLDMYDVEVELTESDLLKFLLKHKFTTTQNGISSMEIIYKKTIFKINSELNLPKSHVLTVSWLENSFTINSKVDTKSISPFNSVITHDLNMNGKLLATITNTAELDYEKVLYSFKSTGRTPQTDLYSINLGMQLNSYFAFNKIKYDFASKIQMKIPPKKIDFTVEMKQFANIKLDGEINIKDKTFESKIVYKNQNKDTFGYEIIAEEIKADETLNQIKTTIYRGTAEDKYIIKTNKKKDKILYGFSVDSEKLINYEVLWKMNNENGKITSSFLMSLDIKRNNNYNFYYKNNMEILVKLQNTFSLTWNGKYGKASNANLIPFQGSIKYFGTGVKDFDINFDVSHPVLSMFKLSKVILGFNFKMNSGANNKGTMTSNAITKWQFENERTAKYYELKLNGNYELKSWNNVFDMEAVIVKDSSLNKLLELNSKLKLGSNNVESSFKLKYSDKYITMAANANFMDIKNISFLLSIKTSNSLLKELTISSELKTLGTTFQGKSNFFLKSAKSYNIQITQVRKLDLTNGEDLVSNVKWESNIPYLNSGSYVFGYLMSKNRNAQINFSLIYKNSKKINVKFSFDSKSNEFQILGESFIVFPLKVSLIVSRISKNTYTVNSEFGFKEKFLKISDSKVSWIFENGKNYVDFAMSLQSSNEVFSDMTFAMDSYYETGKFFQSYKSNLHSKYKGKTIQLYKIDLPSGEIKIDSQLGYYIKYSSLSSIKFDMKYKFNSIRDMSMKYKMLLNPAFDEIQFEFIYFRNLEGEKPKNFETFGEAKWFCKMDFKCKDNLLKAVGFVDKNFAKGVFNFQANIPKISLKFNEVLFNVEIQKESDSSYKGTAKYKELEYKFRYKPLGLSKQSLEVEAVSKNTQPKIITLSYDFNDNLILKVSIDKVLKFDVNLKSESGEKKAGTVELVFNDKNILKVYLNVNVKYPSDVKTINDAVISLFKFKKGIYFKYQINGKIFEKNVKRTTEMYHMKSEKFPGGTKSFYSSETTIESARSMSSKTLISLDGNSPMYEWEDACFLKVDNELIFDVSHLVKFISYNDIMVRTSSIIKNKYKSNILAIYNAQIIQFNGKFEFPEKDILLGFGFRVARSNDLDLSLAYCNNNYTFSTNLGNLISLDKRENYFPVGKEYYIVISKTYEIRIARKKSMEYEAVLNCNWPKPLKVNVMIEIKKEKWWLELKGSSPFEQMKSFNLKFTNVYLQNPYEFIVSIRLNKKQISDLNLKIYLAYQNTPYSIKLNYKGNKNVNGEISLDVKNYKFSHSIVVKDGAYKTELWSCFSKCQIMPTFDCYITHKNSAREIVVGMNLEKNVKRLELTWHKSKRQSLILTIKEKSGEKIILFENPMNKIRLMRAQVIQHDEKVGKLYLDVESIGKSTEKNNFINVNYAMKGSLKSDYKLEVKLNTSLMHKEVKVVIKRDVSLDIGDLYALEVNASFVNEKSAFFTVKGYLRQLSTRSYEVKLHSTNYDRFATLTITTIFASEEISLEYKLIQSDLPAKEFLFQYIPLRKFHLTNKKDLNILMNRVMYQYGYRSDYALKLGKDGLDISAFSTFSRSPIKYYLEINRKDEKIVIHLRPVGNFIIGELYRKTSDKKMLDASLKLNIDDRNVLNSKLYWNPELLERIKKLLDLIFNPKNIRNLMTQTYQNSENQLSKYLSSVKMDIIKNVNVPVSLDFAKSIVNDWEEFPKTMSLSYENDNYYIKTALKKMSDGFAQMDFSLSFNRFQNSCSELKNVLSSSLYEWFVEAKLYSIFYEPIKNKLNSFTYDHIKSGIQMIVNCGKRGFQVYKVIVGKIADVMGIISEKAKKTLFLSNSLKNALKNVYSNSLIMDLFSIMADLKTEVLNILEKIMQTDIIKQRIKYYQDAIKDSEETINLILSFKNKVLEYFKTSNAVTNILKTIEFIRSLKYKEAFLNLVKLEETKLQMNLDEASIEFKMYVPPVSMTYFKILKTFTNWLPSQTFYKVAKLRISDKLLELFYRYEYIMFNYGSYNFESLRKLLPPFSKTAWVLDGNSILTFDGNAIKIGSGQCSYLLARDFKKGSFSLVMNVDSKNNKIEYELSYINKIVIRNDGRVSVDGKIVNILPAVFKDEKRNFAIYRNDDLVKIKTSEGIVIKYFNEFKSLKIMAIGFWHGSIKGLLGSNDFEKSNDLSTPTGLITHDAGVLSKSWSLGKCDAKTKTGLYSIKISTSQLQECENTFQPDSLSYLKRCFSLINPEPYFALCHRTLQYGPKSKSEFKELLCSLSRNYVMRCKSKGILIRLDKTCVNCGKINLNKKISDHELQKNSKFHYIFIIEQSKCIESYRVLIENLAKMMGLKPENIFTLLSFNGKDVYKEVHFKTINNKMYVNYDEIMKLLQEAFSPEQLTSKMTEKKITEPGQAIYDVIKMSSVPGFTEKIVLLTCSACSEHQKYGYSLLAGLLNNAGISISYLTTETFTGGNSDVVGIANKMVYTFEKDKIKKVQWKRNIQLPSDACSALARLKDGNIWSLKPLVDDMRNRRLSEVIHEELIKPKINSQTCYCMAGNYENGKTECKISKFRQTYSMLF